MLRARALALLLVAMLAVTAPAAALAATPQATLPDVEDEVMCTQCGTPLNISEAPAADRQRAFIRALIERGRMKDEIKAELKEEYGPRVLAIPSAGGFDNAAWLVPVVAGLAGILGVAFAARRWRRCRSPDAPRNGESQYPPLDPAHARRLDAELSAFDR